MASVDAGQFSLSSDEKMSEFACNPCKDDGVVREATYYCPECSEHFCSSCEASCHRRPKATKSHSLLSANEAIQTTNTTTEKPAKLPIMTCVCNRDALVEFACDEHKCLVCTECRILYHRKCKIDAIADKNNTENRDVLNALLQQARSMEDEANYLCAEYNETLEMFEANKSKCREEITQIRDQLVVFIEKLVNTAFEKLNAASMTDQYSPISDVTACKTMLDKLKEDQKLLQIVMESEEHQHMFIVAFLLRESFKNYTSLLDEVKLGRKYTTVVFQANLDLVDMERKFKNVGHIIVKHKQMKAHNFPKSLLKLKVEKKEPFDITPSEVNKMTGCTFLPSGDFVVCDNESCSVILLDLKFQEKSRVSMSGRIWSVSVIDETNIIVSHTGLKKLEIVEVVPTLKIKDSIEVGRKCFDVKAFDSKIYVVCTDDPGDGEIRVIDMEGNVMNRFGYKNGTYFFNRPIHMATNHVQDKMYVSDIGLNSTKVVCMTVDGTVEFIFTKSGIETPRGILVDEEGNFLLCSDDIYLVEAGGNRCTKFLTKREEINGNPFALCYRECDRSLVVAFKTKLLVFKLTEK